MKRDPKIKQLKDVGSICAAQRQRAEMEVERLNARLDRLRLRRDQEGRNLEAQEQGWKSAVTGGSLQLTASAVWASEILRTEAAITNTERDMGEVRAMRRGLCDVLQGLSARADAVDGLTARAVRLDARRRDEAAMEDHRGRTVSGWGAACE